MNTRTAVLDVLAKVTGRPAGSFTDETTFADSGVDSLAMLEIAMAVQNDLDVPVDESEVAETRTVGELLALVEGAATVRQ